YSFFNIFKSYDFVFFFFFFFSSRRRHTRSKRDWSSDVCSSDLTPIDLVVVNLYPFRETVAKPGVSFEQAIEQIDIGGPSMLRSRSEERRVGKECRSRWSAYQ